MTVLLLIGGELIVDPDRANRRVSSRWGKDARFTLSPHFHSPLFLLSPSSILLIQVPLYNSCPGAAPAFFGAGLERERKKKDRCSIFPSFVRLSISVCVLVDHSCPLFACNTDCGAGVVQHR